MDALKPARVEETAGRATASYTAACPSDGEKAASNVNEYRGPGPSPSSGHAVTSPGARTVSSSVDTSRASGGLTRTATRTVSGQSADELASDEALDDDRRPREALSTARTTMFGRLSQVSLVRV